MAIKEAYTANSAEVGDVFVCIVTCHVTPMGFQLYRCPWPQSANMTPPQGPRMFSVPGGQLSHMVQQLFSIVPNVGVKEAR